MRIPWELIKNAASPAPPRPATSAAPGESVYLINTFGDASQAGAGNKVLTPTVSLRVASNQPPRSHPYSSPWVGVWGKATQVVFPPAKSADFWPPTSPVQGTDRGCLSSHPEVRAHGTGAPAGSQRLDPSVPLPGLSVSLNKEARTTCHCQGWCPIAVPTLHSRK